ncbi:hypothetical protein [Cerasicoccus maritimus]|uniref:hypothetical protein n=1 Tax=Cerasicoccus maritimus TaxID=490089 RepID=UPI00285273ED|nr:hypothetical protein [Cerasicoccus maritimus]
MKEWLWIGGWGLSAEMQQQVFAARWPEFEHTVLYPGKLCIAKLKTLLEAGDVKRLGGYSLGALLLLREQANLPKLPTMLLAPILDFKAEALKGGRVDGRRLSVLLRWLLRDPIDALNDFYQTAGLKASVDVMPPYDVDDLIWGIEQLAAPGVDYWRWEHVHACLGERDALLDAAQLQQLWPELVILPDAGHDFSELLEEVAI